MAQLLEQIERLTQPILDDLGLELVELEYQRESHGWVLRFYLDKEGGINLDECADASREIAALLDVEDLLETAYQLEVSSPGLDRPLKKMADYQRFAGNRAKIKTRLSCDPDQRGYQRKTFVGELRGVEGEQVLLEQTDAKGGQVAFTLDQIEKANLEFEF
ncbi:MAG: ribosome maturation factor RimP [Desulfuromonadales bacterium]|nr:ribosome maturation factor RimP [Desulfuromonadales bacterium]